MTLMDVNSELGDERISESALGQGVHGDGKLANADKADPELRDRDQTEGKLTDGNNASGRHRHTVGSVFERDVEHRKPQETRLGFVFETPPIPFVLGRKRGPATGTGRCLLRNLMLAFPARFHAKGRFVVVYVENTLFEGHHTVVAGSPEEEKRANRRR
jgi:hypothetical protein